MFKSNSKQKQNNENNDLKDDFYENEEYLQILKELKERDNRKNEFKNISISSKEEAIEFLKSINDGEELSWAYMYSITDELKADKDIFEYIKNKFVFTEDDSYRVHASGIVETFGRACGKCNTDESKRQALNEVIAFSSEHSLIAYWIFYALNGEHPIPFETYLNIYKLFNHNLTVQGYLLNHYSGSRKREKFEGEMIRLLDASSDECINENWYMAVNDDFFPISVYHVLLRRGISKEKLDEDYNRYLDSQKRERKREIEEQEEKAKCLKKQKRKEWLNRWKR